MRQIIELKKLDTALNDDEIKRETCEYCLDAQTMPENAFAFPNDQPNLDKANEHLKISGLPVTSFCGVLLTQLVIIPIRPHLFIASYCNRILRDGWYWGMASTSASVLHIAFC